MSLFKITFFDNDGIKQSIKKEFEDSENITAREWVEDYTYNIADKATATIEEVQKSSSSSISSRIPSEKCTPDQPG